MESWKMASRRPPKAHIPSAQCWRWGTYTQPPRGHSNCQQFDGTINYLVFPILHLILNLYWSYLGTHSLFISTWHFQLDNYLFPGQPMQMLEYSLKSKTTYKILILRQKTVGCKYDTKYQTNCRYGQQIKLHNTPPHQKNKQKNPLWFILRLPRW